MCYHIFSDNEVSILAKELIKSVISELTDKSLELHMLEDNKNAIQVYKDCDFVLSGKFEDVYAYAYKEKAPVYRKWFMNK